MSAKDERCPICKGELTDATLCLRLPLSTGHVLLAGACPRRDTFVLAIRQPDPTLIKLADDEDDE